MQYLAAAEKGAEVVRDIAAFTRANPGQAWLNKLTLYTAAKELGSDFRMVRRYVRKARRYVRRPVRRIAGRKRMRKTTGTFKKRRKSYSRRFHPSTQITTGAKRAVKQNVMNFGEQHVTPWFVGTGSSTLLTPGSRLKAYCFVKGIRICVRLHNEGSRSLEYHWALIQSKTVSNGSPLDGIDAANDAFWTSNKQGDVDKFADFDEDTPKTNWSAYLSCGRISTSKYRVITHKKVVVAGEPIFSGTGFRGNSHLYIAEKYIKMNKRVLFNAITDVSGRFPVYFVDWCTYPAPSDYPNVLTAAATRYVEMTTYYKT